MRRPTDLSRVAVAMLAILIAWLGAPRAQQPPSPPSPTAPAQPGAPAQPAPAPAPAQPPARVPVPVAASSLATYPDTYMGEFVSMTGAVEQSLSKSAFSVDQDKTKPTGKEVLVLAPTLNGVVDPNTYVTIMGEVVRFDPAEIAKKAKDYQLDLSPELIAKYSGKPTVIATAVINAAMIDIAKRLPPPMTAEEEAYDKVMKRVGPAFAALRNAVTASDVNVAKQNAAILKQAFTETEAFWKSKAKTDALQWAQDARKQSEAVEREATAGNWDGVKSASGTLGEACQSCHGVYRERFDDGTFRIKMGGK
jgi:cytochrome c556